MKDQGLEVKKVNPIKDGLLILSEIVKYFFNRKIIKINEKKSFNFWYHWTRWSISRISS